MTNRTDNQRRHVRVTTERRLVALCTISLAASVLFLSPGCASTQSKLTAEDRSQLGRIAITKAYEKPNVVFGGVPNAAKGAAAGILGGIILPPAWFMGGPFALGPIMAIESARCGGQFANVKDPDQQFEAAVNAARPDEFLLKYLADRIEGAGLGRPAVLETPLKRLDSGNFDVTSIADHRIDAVLQVEQFKISLLAEIGKSPCSPQVAANIVWHFVRVSDGRQIAAGSDYRYVNSAHPFSAFFKDAAYIQTILNELIEKVARDMMCRSGADSSSCSRYVQAAVKPSPAEPAHVSPQ